MPRVTRAALRSMEQQDDSDNAASTSLPQMPSKSRVPLDEVSGNKGMPSEATNTSEEQVAPSKREIGKGKKGNNAKKANKGMREKAEEVHVEVLEDESQSIHSSAAKEACQDLLKDGFQGHKGAPQVIFDNDRPQTPPSTAVNTASRDISPKISTPYLDSEMPNPDGTATLENKEEEEDSFVAKIESRTPLKIKSSERTGLPMEKERDKDDSYVEQIKTRTPSKRISRIEDSVEALDALEEEIEKVGGLIPASAEGLQSPVKARKQAKPQRTTMDAETSGSTRTKKSAGTQKKMETRRPSTAVGSAGPTKSRARPSTSLARNRTSTAAQAAGSTRNAGQATSQAVLKKRISSVHRAPFQPTKSTKPPTRPNFELPGDAIARKLKEQREQRSKREEEGTPKPRPFKAQPVRLSHAPEVKLTAATKARLSMAKGEPISKTGPSNGFDNSKPFARPGPMATISSIRRLSTISVVKRSTQPTASGPTQPSANYSARLTRGPSLNVSTTTRAPSALSATRSVPTAEESAQQKLKGKEVFDRTKIEIMEREKAKKEKEDAAKKARADAAERGRIASRAWAKKQKVRKAEAENVIAQGKAVEA